MDTFSSMKGLGLLEDQEQQRAPMCRLRGGTYEYICTPVTLKL